ncbi:MAG TPA: ComEC/Rec2 family competence protein [Acidimicrobiia bacterium]|jgi:competence protein ComEC|nr:ComEC/Rec2 family competence protein [Acidimicrobiia bacterium]
MSLRFRELAGTVVPDGRRSLVAAGVTWFGALIGMWGQASPALVVVLAVLGTALLLPAPRLGLLAILCAAGSLSGASAAERIAATLNAEIDAGPISAAATLTTDPVPGYGGWDLLVRLHGTGPNAALVVRVVADDRPELVVGDLVGVEGDLRHRSGRLRGDPYSATVAGAELVKLAGASNSVVFAGNAVRGLVLHRLERHLDRPAAALMAGFLVGDTTRLPALELDELRSSGLTHYVAVSGSNVALFLAAWWIVLGPLPLSLRVRAASGLVALVVFVVATRWEPSVVRASAMAAVALGGRLLGFPVSAWRALGTAVSVLLLVSGDLAADVGFQLSAGATAGVLVGARLPLWRRPRWLWRSLVVTACAQAAVLPVLLITFGQVPLMSPLTNLLAAPLVTVATVAGAVGLLAGVDVVLEVGLSAADLVLLLADRAADWPQLDVGGAAVVLAGLLALRLRSIRPIVAAAAVVSLVAWWVPPAYPVWPAITFLDVGQGDAILLRSPGGETALVDGGRDPALLRAALRRAGVSDIDLLVVTHGDADHVGGLRGLFDRHRVRAVWFADLQEGSELLTKVLQEADQDGVPIVPVGRGHRASLGEMEIEVLGPARRFAAENDGSVVLWLQARGATALLTGDIEAVGQSELPEVRPDIIQVPHHGSATTDLRWLADTVGSVAVISVGVNTYGHPTSDVLETLEDAGVRVFTTQAHGDVTAPLCARCAG